MSVYVGIDVHRKRSQVAVVAEDGTVQLNKNTVNGTEPILRLIGDLPAGTPVAFEAAFGWSWLAELLEDYGFEAHLVHPLRCKAIASARLKNDKVDAAILAQLLRADLLPEAWIAPRPVRQLRALLRHRAGLVRLRTQQQNRIHAVVADFGYDRSGSYLSGPGRGWLAGLELPAVSREIVADCLAVIDGLAPVTGRIDGELRQHAKADPRVKTLTTLPGVGQFTALVMLAEIGDITRFGSARKLASWAGLTPTVRGPGPDRPARAHSRAGLGLAAVGAEPGRADCQAVAGVRRHLCRHCPAPREEDRHHRDLPQAADPRLAPAQPAGTGRCQHAAAAAMKTGGSPSPGHARPSA
jgi:transposase